MENNNQSGKQSSMMKKVNPKFSAVDLITCVVFAALFRVLWIVFKAAGVVFPFNHSFMGFFVMFCLVACVAVVKKPMACLYYTIGWICINFFLQGEIPHYFVCIIILPLFPELYWIYRGKTMSDPSKVYHSFKDLLAGGLVYEVIYFVFTFEVAIKRVFLIPVDMKLQIAAFAGAIALAVFGIWVGLNMGKRLNSLIK